MQQSSSVFAARRWKDRGSKFLECFLSRSRDSSPVDPSTSSLKTGTGSAKGLQILLGLLVDQDVGESSKFNLYLLSLISAMWTATSPVMLIRKVITMIQYVRYDRFVLSVFSGLVRTVYTGNSTITIVYLQSGFRVILAVWLHKIAC